MFHGVFIRMRSVFQRLIREQEAWLSNFTDNPIEWFSKYNVKFSKGYYEHIPKMIASLKQEILKKPDQKERLEAIMRN
jgi:phospholipase C